MARAQGSMAGWAGRTGRVLALALLLALGAGPGDAVASRVARALQTPPVPQLPRVRCIPQPPAQKPSAGKPFVAKPSGEELLLFRLESRLLERLGQGWGIDDRDLQGYTLLERCCADKAFDSEAMVALFVRHHANLSTQSAIGLTPLNYAIASSSQRTVEALAAAGADVNAFDYEGPRWRQALLSFVSGAGSFAKCRTLMERDPSVAMVAGRDVILRRNDVESPAVRRTFDESLAYAAEKFGIRPERPEFVAGTMFLAKAEVFRPFLGRFSARDFDVSVKDDTVVTLAHVLERAIGFSACAAGRIADPDDSMRLRHLRTDVYQATAPIRRFLCQTKTTRSGARITKICRIPVWHSRKASK